jgi:hypothetical protein
LSRVRGKRRSPFPPAMMMVVSFFKVSVIDSPAL